MWHPGKAASDLSDQRSDSAAGYRQTAFKTKERGFQILQSSIIRTLEGRLVRVKLVNIKEERVCTRDYLVPERIGADREVLLKYIRKHYEDGSVRILKVTSSKLIKEVYEISIADFLQYAKKVPAKQVPEKLHLKKRR